MTAPGQGQGQGRETTAVAREDQPDSGVIERVGRIDWAAVEADLDGRGWAVIDALLDPPACAALAALYPLPEPFRKKLKMERYGFGLGSYAYFSYPLPAIVEALRTRLYPPLAAIANRWSAALSSPVRYPAELDDFLARCRDAGQGRPTPLLLAYEEGGFNSLHQDLYGPLAFPLQLAVLLSAPGRDFTGGEFVMTEQRPRKQARVHAVPLAQGDAVVFAGQQRPGLGPRGVHRLNLRHGVCEIRSGRRFTLGIIFHDSR